jgi:hypothetical protein
MTKKAKLKPFTENDVLKAVGLTEINNEDKLKKLI